MCRSIISKISENYVLFIMSKVKIYESKEPRISKNIYRLSVSNVSLSLEHSLQKCLSKYSWFQIWDEISLFQPHFYFTGNGSCDSFLPQQQWSHHGIEEILWSTYGTNQRSSIHGHDTIYGNLIFSLCFKIKIYF